MEKSPKVAAHPKLLKKIFCGTPKPAESPVDITREKSQAMDWIKTQQKKHDVEKSKREANQDM